MVFGASVKATPKTLNDLPLKSHIVGEFGVKEFNFRLGCDYESCFKGE